MLKPPPPYPCKVCLEKENKYNIDEETLAFKRFISWVVNNSEIMDIFKLTSEEGYRAGYKDARKQYDSGFKDAQ